MTFDDCEGCGQRVRDLYHNETRGIALCHRCDIEQDALDAKAAADSALRKNVGDALALIERLHDWHAGRVTALMATPLERRDESFVVNIGSHMRSAHDLRVVADTLEGKR